MSLFKAKLEPGQYHIKELQLQSASDADLQNWSVDPSCMEREDAAKHLAARAEREAAIEAESQKAELERTNARILRRDALSEYPFDPRTEVSPDAKYIAGRVVGHLWTIFVLMPIALGILYEVLK